MRGSMSYIVKLSEKLRKPRVNMETKALHLMNSEMIGMKSIIL